MNNVYNRLIESKIHKMNIMFHLLSKILKLKLYKQTAEAN